MLPHGSGSLVSCRSGYSSDLCRPLALRLTLVLGSDSPIVLTMLVRVFSCRQPALATLGPHALAGVENQRPV